MKFKLTYIVSISVLISFQSISQSNEKVLSYDEFVLIVKENHPVYKQADLQISYGESNLLMARGSFDPKLYGDLSQKYFEGDKYYSLLDAGLKVPTWFGIELKSGFEQNAGVYLDPHSKTPPSGLVYAGISLPLGQGLFIDERRTELKKAKIYKESTVARRQEILNELMYEAGKAYWSWFEAYNNKNVYENALQLAEQRYKAVVASAFLGDRPSIDTVEAYIQVQQRQLNLQQSTMELINTRNILSVFLWNEGLIPMELAENTIPGKYDLVVIKRPEAGLQTMTDSLVNSHPVLNQSKLAIESLQADLRWKKEQLKPDLDLNYNALSAPVGNSPFAQYSINNYKWGVDLVFPVLLRKERGSLKLTDLKINDYQLELLNKTAAIEAKSLNALNEWRISGDQVETTQQMVNFSKQLLEGEQNMFKDGESSLFMINSREMTYISSELKLIEVKAKNQKAALQYGYSTGRLGTE